jgi:hypothetical protein
MLSMNLVTPEAAAKLELLFNRPRLVGSTKAEALLKTRFISMLCMNLVTPEAAAKLELLFNKLNMIRVVLFPFRKCLKVFFHRQNIDICHQKCLPAKKIDT